MTGGIPMRSDVREVTYDNRPRPKKTLAPVETTEQKPASEAASTPAETSSPKLSESALALARKEQALRKQQMEMKARLDAAEAAQKELQELRDLKAKLEAKDFATVEKFAPYDEYTNYLTDKLNGSNPERDAINEVKSEIEALKKRQEEETAVVRKQALEARKRAISELVSAKPTEFTSISKLKMESAVLQHITDSWEKDSVELSVEQAAKEVEEALKEQARKWSSVLEDKVAVAGTENTAKSLPPLKNTVKTLTNSMAATGDIKLPKKSYADMSEAERYRAAAQRVKEANERLKG
jgi:hypothetical protein